MENEIENLKPGMRQENGIEKTDVAVKRGRKPYPSEKRLKVFGLRVTQRQLTRLQSLDHPGMVIRQLLDKWMEEKS